MAKHEPRSGLGLIALLGFVLAGCSSATLQPQSAGEGPNPFLPPPHSTVIPTVNIAMATGWVAGEAPHAAPGLQVTAFAKGLDHPRWLQVLPNGDVLVAETNAPAQHDSNGGFKGWVMKKVMARAGAGMPSPDRIILLRGLDQEGQAAVRTVFLTGLHSPFGMAVAGDYLYVANTDAVMRYPYAPGATQITDPGTKVMDLPAGKINHHWTKSLIASPDGKRLYVTVGSNSNVAENGINEEDGRAAIHELDLATGTSRIFATGLRNPNGMSWHPQSGALWVVVNERDEIGNDLVPDYMTSVKDGGFYGWPYSYYGQHLDERVKGAPEGSVAAALPPDYALGAHTGSLGLAFYNGQLLPGKYRGGAFVGQHGSWNRKPHSGYKVIFIPFANGMPVGASEDVLTGFLDAQGRASGRPVGVAVDNLGALLVADDVGNAVWRVTTATP